MLLSERPRGEDEFQPDLEERGSDAPPRKETVLDKFRKGAVGRTARTFALMSTLGAGVGQEALARERDDPTAYHVGTIDKAKLTELSRWAENYVAAAEQGLKKLGTLEEADRLIRATIFPFLAAYYVPKGPDLAEGPFGKTPKYSGDDLRFLAEKTGEMIKIFEKLCNRLGPKLPARYVGHGAQLKDMARRLGEQLAASRAQDDKL